MSLDQKPKNLVMNNPVRLEFKNYELMSVLGEGAFGKVRLAKNKKTGEYIALKQLKELEITKMKQIDHLKNENFILTSLEHCMFIKKCAASLETNTKISQVYCQNRSLEAKLKKKKKRN